MKPIRVLYVSGGSLDYGGISTVMLNYASRFDPAKVRVDFLVHGLASGPREEEAKALGAQIIHVPHKRDGYEKNRRALLDAFRAGGYDIVHAHMDGMNGYVLSLALRAGVPRRISHSHNTQFLTTNPLRLRLHRLTANRIPRVATDMLACSEAAGRFLYGDALFDAGRVAVVPNAIALSRFRFDAPGRERLRDALGVADKFVIGHIGRLDYQKNQEFLLPVLEAVRKTRPETVLLLVGDGDARAELQAEIDRRGLADGVRLLGYREDVHTLLSAFDLFALPSRFEGLGIVLIEAQRSGLPCLASAEVPRETRVTDCRYLPLDDQGAWINAITDAKPYDARAREAVDDAPFAAVGYDIDREAERMQSLYLERDT